MGRRSVWKKRKPSPDLDLNPTGGGKLPNEYNSTLTSGTRGLYPHCYISMLMSGVTAYAFSMRVAVRQSEIRWSSLLPY